MTGRLNTCQKILQKKKISAFLVSNFYNVGYLSGFFPLSPQEREVCLLLTKDKFFLITDGRYIGEVKAQKTGFTCLATTPTQGFFKAIASLCQKLKIKKLGFEKQNLTFAEYGKLKVYQLIPTENLVEEKRAIKDTHELKSIKKACQIADQAFSHLLGFLKPGMTEKEVADEIEWFIRKKGACDLSFDPIVASGSNSAFPHHRSGNKKLQKKDVILLDFGAKVESYCSDMTRVVFLGKASSEQKKVYQTVLEAQKRAVEQLSNLTMKQWSNKTMKQSPIKTSDIDHIARSYITSHGYPTIPHGLGHGVGLCEHETPHLSPKSRDILKPGMVFSVEPGIYIPGKFGVRIEDLVALTPSGPQILTKNPKKIIEI